MFLDPTLDVVFKLMLTTQPESPEVLTALIEAILKPSVPIRSVTVLNPELPKETIRDKGIRLDVAVVLDDGRALDLEMQTSRRTGFRDRALYYWARLFLRGLEVGQEYEVLRPAVSILLLDYIELETPSWHTTFQLLEAHPYPQRARVRWSDRIELHVLELPKARLAARIDDGNEDLKLLSWLKFLKATTVEERKVLCMSDPAMTKAQAILDRLGDDPEAQRLAKERQVEEYFWHLDRKLDLDAAEAKGRAQGEALGEIRAYCGIFGLELTESQQAALAHMDLPALLVLLDHIKTERRWPA